MEILGIIPARGGSKGIKRKNIKQILGKPLVAYSIEASLNSKYITKTIVSSEDDEILEISAKYGAEVMKRPEELAQDTTKTAPVMIDVVEKLIKTGYHPDYVVLLQPTCPLRDANFIDSAFDFYFENMKKGYDSCFNAFNMGTTHSKWKYLHDGRMEALYDYRNRPRRQDSKDHYTLYGETGAFYAVATDIMLEVGDFIGRNPVPYVTNFVVDIDTEEDFKRVEDILKK